MQADHSKILTWILNNNFTGLEGTSNNNYENIVFIILKTLKIFTGAFMWADHLQTLTGIQLKIQIDHFQDSRE